MNKSKTYTLIIPKNVVKELKAINEEDSLKITDKLHDLVNSTVSLDIKKLAGYRNLYRLRCGEYRIIYEVHEQVLIILVI